jgi:hypothetical protein
MFDKSNRYNSPLNSPFKREERATNRGRNGDLNCELPNLPPSCRGEIEADDKLSFRSCYNVAVRLIAHGIESDKSDRCNIGKGRNLIKKLIERSLR